MYALFKDGKIVSNTFVSKDRCRAAWIAYWSCSKISRLSP